MTNNTSKLSFKDYWQQLDECGWLADTPKEAQNDLKKRLQKAYKDNPASAYEELAVFSFDTECIYGTGPADDFSTYTSIIQLYAQHSDGSFAPCNIIDQLDEKAGVIHVGFDHKGKSFKCDAPLEDDWFAMEVHELVNQAVASSGEQRQFLPLPVIDQIIYLAFVKPKTYDMAVEMGLIPQSLDGNEFEELEDIEY